MEGRARNMRRPEFTPRPTQCLMLGFASRPTGTHARTCRFRTCSPLAAASRTGRHQSPIDVVSGQAVDGAGMEQLLDFIDYRPMRGLAMVNAGHYLRMDASFGTLNLLGSHYDATRVLFHSPSEHQLDGAAYAMEMQIFHQLAGSASLAVVSVLFNEGDNSTLLADLRWDALPHRGQETDVPGVLNLLRVGSRGNHSTMTRVLACLRPPARPPTLRPPGRTAPALPAPPVTACSHMTACAEFWKANSSTITAL